MWLLPTLNRPEKLRQFCRAARLTGTRTPGLLLVDKSDYLANERTYLDLEEHDLPDGWKIHITDSVSMGDKIRERWDFYSDAKWVGILNDDHVPRTARWDARLIEQLTGRNFMSCNDRWCAPTKAAGATVWSGDLIRAVGYLFPPNLRHLYIDDLWELIGRKAGCWNIDMSVIVEHRHVLKGAESDSTHELVYNQELWEKDRLIFQKWLNEEAAATLERVKALGGSECKPTN